MVKLEKVFHEGDFTMTRAEKRNEKKKYGKDFASFCQILNRYFPDFSVWLASLKDPNCLKKVLHKGTENRPYVCTGSSKAAAEIKVLCTEESRNMESDPERFR